MIQFTNSIRESIKVFPKYSVRELYYRHIISFIFAISLVITLQATNIVNENIQSWTAHSSYGSYTQQIPAGIVTMTRCLVSPGAVANGTGSIGRIQCEATTGIVEFPAFSSIGQVEFNFAAGSTGRSIKLQKYISGSWVDVTIFNGITATGTAYYYALNIAEQTTIRLANPSHAIYIHDIFITDYQGTETPQLTTLSPTNITYNSAIISAIVESAGSAPITTKGFCWGIDPTPDTTFSHVSLGSGISPYSTTITGLSFNTEYYVRAYAVNSHGIGYGNSVSFLTSSIGVPAIQTSNINIYPGNYSIEATWTPGDGSKRIVKVNTLNSFTAPLDGNAYPANPIYTSGEQVVYNGATQIIEGEPVNAVTITGLIPNTTYWLRAYEYNGEGSTTLYNTTSAVQNPTSGTTLNSNAQGYYDSITGTGANLKTNLHNLIRTTHSTQFSYDAVWTQLQFTDEDSINTNNVIETYTGWSVPKSFYGGGTTNWNREHTWSVSHGGFETNRPAGTDLHHLRPCDATVNSAKGNKDFDNGGNAYTDSSPYTGYSGVTGCNTDTDSWEPRPVEKGDVARMIMYMAVRYEGTDTTYDLEMQDTTPTTGAFYGKLSTLLQWHVQDPPDSWERRRNNRIQERQGNRNPFIDHPEYVNLIWAPSSLHAVPLSPTSFSLTWIPAVNAVSYVIDIAYDNMFNNILTGYNNQNIGNITTLTVSNLTTNTNYYIRMRACFGSGYGMNSSIESIFLSDIVPPYALSSYTCVENIPNNVLNTWVTEYETGLLGFNIYRSLTSNIETATCVNTSIISATNTSQEHTYNFNNTNVLGGMTYYYWLNVIEINGNSSFFGPQSIFVHGMASDDNISNTPNLHIVNVYPNPFIQNVTIELETKQAVSLNISIYNLKGQKIKQLFNGINHAGLTSLVWDGRDFDNKNCATGLYFIRVISNGRTIDRKLILK